MFFASLRKARHQRVWSFKPIIMSSAPTPQQDIDVSPEPMTEPLNNSKNHDDSENEADQNMISGEEQRDQEQEQEDEAMEEADSATMSLPLARIKKIFKMDTEHHSASLSAVYATGCATELFIQYLVEHASMMAKMEKRKKIQYKDLSNVVSDQDALHFLSDTVPKTQIVGEAIRNRKINMLDADKTKHSDLLGPEDAQDNTPLEESAPQKKSRSLPKGQQTLSFEPVKKSPVKKAGITDLMSNDDKEDAMAVDHQE